MDSTSKNKRSSVPSISTTHTPGKAFTSHTDSPTTPPNLYSLSPPGAPRAQRLRRRKEIVIEYGQPSTPSRIQNRLNNRLVGLRETREAGNSRNLSSQSPRDRLLSYRSRSPLGSHHRIRKSTEVESVSLLIKPGTQGSPLFLVGNGNQATSLPNVQLSDQLDLGARYWKTLSFADTEHNERMAGSLPSATPNDNNENVTSTEKHLDDLYKTGRPFRYDEHGFK